MDAVVKPRTSIEDRLEFLDRLLRNAEEDNSLSAAQFIRAVIWGIEFAMKDLQQSHQGKNSTVFKEDGCLHLIIGGDKYPVQLDESLSPGEWYLKGRSESGDCLDETNDQ